MTVIRVLDFACAFQTGERDLDLGCGTGSLSLGPVPRYTVGRICGLNFSAAYVEHARSRTSDPRIRFQMGHACAMRFPDASFDLVRSLLIRS